MFTRSSGGHSLGKRVLLGLLGVCAIGILWQGGDRGVGRDAESVGSGGGEAIGAGARDAVTSVELEGGADWTAERTRAFGDGESLRGSNSMPVQVEQTSGERLVVKSRVGLAVASIELLSLIHI